MLTRATPRRRDERGAVALLIAIAMVGLCVAAAMVVDLGLIRVDRQVDKSAEDAAAMAGANGLVTNLLTPEPLHPFAGVCQALNYLKANSTSLSTFSSSSWTNGSGGAISGAADGCDPSHATDTCTADSPATWARWTGVTADGRSTVVIQSGYKFSSATPATDGNITSVTGGSFSQDALPVYSTDTGDGPKGGCDQVAVIISEGRRTTLGNAGGASSMGTRVRSVARVKIDPPASPYALLILARHQCQVLTNGTNPTAKIEVLGYKSHPGMIHSDSSADDTTTPSCNKPVITGSNPAGVVAHEAPLTNAPGQISTVATSNQSDGLTNVYAGPLPGHGPVSSSLVTRSVVDTIYLNGVIQARQNAAFAWAAAGVYPVGSVTAPASSYGASPGAWTVLPNCAAATGTILATKVLVNCANMNNQASFPNATDVIFTGQVNGSNNIDLPKAVNVYAGGKSSPFGVSPGSGRFTMNDNGAASCPTAFDPTSKRAKLFVYNGSLQVNGGTFRACNTTVILMSNQWDACLPTTTPTYIVDDKPCNGAYGNGIVDFQGNGNVDWTAPDLDDDDVSTPPADTALLEDLALWSEAGDVQGLGGSGTVHLSGVFVAPNARPLKLNGTPTWNVKNSQYVVRTLTNNGGAVFTMQPTPALPVAPPNVTFSLVR